MDVNNIDYNIFIIYTILCFDFKRFIKDCK